jgi:glycosyltransferase involved in cell wall biosynthesis
VEAALVTVVGIAMIKDEADVIERTLRHLAAEGLDTIYLFENNSADGSWEIVRDLRDSGDLGIGLVVISDPEPAYYQSRKMTELAMYARQHSAPDWIVPFDADELWIAPGGLAAWLEGIALPIGVVEFPIYNHYHSWADAGGHPFDAMVWADPKPLPLPKVAFRPSARMIVEPGNHDVSMVRGARANLAGSGAGVHHFPYRSPAQMIQKVRNGAAAYEAATGLPRSTGQHWREMGETLKEHGEAGIRKWYEDAFLYAEPEEAGLVRHPIQSPRAR